MDLRALNAGYKKAWDNLKLLKKSLEKGLTKGGARIYNNSSIIMFIIGGYL